MTAKDLRLAPIRAEDARRFVRANHYSGKVVNNSQLHFGVFWGGRLEGALQFGPCLDKKRILHLVEGTTWNGFLELNRMVFTDRLPRNSESRALGVALRSIRKAYPHVKWIISFADGTQCGDGTIYRAAGFLLTQIKGNRHLRVSPTTGKAMQSMTAHNRSISSSEFNTWKRLDGFQLRYIKFLDPAWRERLAVPVLPYSAIAEAGAGMYKGRKRCAGQASDGGFRPHSGGVTPTGPLHT